MKYLILSLLLLALNSTGYAQVIHYRYDKTGNRKYRGPDITVQNGRQGLIPGDSLYAPLSEKIRVYPNPVGSQLNIDIQNFSDIMSTYTMYDLQGKTLMKVDMRNIRYTVNLEHLATGIYILKIVIDEKEETYKIIKE